MPEPIPLGLTLREPMTLAMVPASLVKRSFGGNVETVFTFCTHLSRRDLVPLRNELDDLVFLDLARDTEAASGAKSRLIQASDVANLKTLRL